MPHRLDAWLYKGGRPNRVARILNSLWSRMASSGRAPKQLHTLEVGGRRSGRLISFPVVVADFEGERYLVAMLGENVNWVANVRAARGHAVLRHGGREEVLLLEVDRRDPWSDPSALPSACARSWRPHPCRSLSCTGRVRTGRRPAPDVRHSTGFRTSHGVAAFYANHGFSYPFSDRSIESVARPDAAARRR